MNKGPATFLTTKAFPELFLFCYMSQIILTCVQGLRAIISSMFLFRVGEQAFLLPLPLKCRIDLHSVSFGPWLFDTLVQLFWRVCVVFPWGDYCGLPGSQVPGRMAFSIIPCSLWTGGKRAPDGLLDSKDSRFSSWNEGRFCRNII